MVQRLGVNDGLATRLSTKQFHVDCIDLGRQLRGAFLLWVASNLISTFCTSRWSEENLRRAEQTYRNSERFVRSFVKKLD
jgi:hypothetical protein